MRTQNRNLTNPKLKLNPENSYSVRKKTEHDLLFIQALGALLTNYQSDLVYIREFHRYKNSKSGTADYLQKNTGTFKSFLNEFRIARNIDRTKTNVLLQITIDYVSTRYANEVDTFAEYLKSEGITHGKVMTSLASKVLFLNNPWHILPMDNQGKYSLGLQNNFYSIYYQLITQFKVNYEAKINLYLEYVKELLESVEREFDKEIKDLRLIRLNRFIDKILWTNGRDKGMKLV
jgi:hypothetical protein